MMQSIKDDKFDLLKNNKFISLIISKDNSHQLLNLIINKIQNEYDEIIYISKNVDEKKDYINYFDENKFNGNTFNKLLSYDQKSKLFVFDSYINRKNNLNILKNICLHFKTYNSSVIILNNKCELLNPIIYNNIDYIFQFNTKNSLELKRIYGYFIDKNKSFYNFKDIFIENVNNLNKIMMCTKDKKNVYVDLYYNGKNDIDYGKFKLIKNYNIRYSQIDIPMSVDNLLHTNYTSPKRNSREFLSRE